MWDVSIATSKSVYRELLAETQGVVQYNVTSDYQYTFRFI